MCAWSAVSRSGYYRWREREPSFDASYREIVRVATIEKFHPFKKRYGAPRLVLELNEDGVACCVNQVAKLMSEEGLKARNGKNFKYSPAGVEKNNVAGNLLNVTLMQAVPIKNGCQILPIFPSREVTFFLRLSWISFHGR
ncbi:MAG: putative transposase [Candidatus Endobugula sp.]|jgi:putative transposase